MYAIVDINGKQYKAEEGRFIDIDLLHEEEGKAITLDRVLLVSNAGKVTVGQPTISGATVAAKVQNDYKGQKVTVYKMKRKKGYRLKQGHRQQYTRIMIEKIVA